MSKHLRFSASNFTKLEELGLSASTVLRRAGLPQTLCEQPLSLLKTDEYFALWRAIEEVSTNPPIGLQLGTENRTERFHPIGLAALSCETFGSGINRMARYKQLTCPEEILQVKDKEEWSIQFHWLLAQEIEPPVLIECAFSWVLSIARHGTGTRLSPLRVEFIQPRKHVKTIEAGLVDEVSLLLLPGIDGRHDVPSVFDGINPKHPAVPLKLKHVDQLEGGALWIRYEVVSS